MFHFIPDSREINNFEFPSNMIFPVAKYIGIDLEKELSVMIKQIKERPGENKACAWVITWKDKESPHIGQEIKDDFISAINLYNSL